MDTPLQWGAATIAWTPSGYVLSVPSWLDARATLALEESDVWHQIAPGGGVRHTLSERRRTADGFEPGELLIISESLFDSVRPGDLAQLLSQAARRARDDAESAQKADDERAAAFLQALRGS